MRHRQATDDNKIRRMRIMCRINKITYTHSCNSYCFSTATMLTRKRLSVTCIRKLPLLFWGRLSVRYEQPSNQFWTQSTCKSTINPDKNASKRHVYWDLLGHYETIKRHKQQKRSTLPSASVLRVFVNYLSCFGEGCLSRMNSLQINFGRNLLVRLL